MEQQVYVYIKLNTLNYDRRKNWKMLIIKKIVLTILKILLVVIISSVVLKILYDIGISIYQRDNNQTINNIGQNYINDISNQNDASDKLEDN